MKSIYHERPWLKFYPEGVPADIEIPSKSLPEAFNHIKVIIEFQTAPHAVFDDQRNFGQFRVFNSAEDITNYPPIRTLGVDGLAIPFPLKEFITKIQKPN